MNETKSIEALQRAVAMGLRTLASLQETCPECGQRLMATAALSVSLTSGEVYCGAKCLGRDKRFSGMRAPREERGS